MQAAIAQKDEQFVPHVVAVTVGSTVAFPNQDPIFHNVFSLSRGASFNLGRYPSGSSRSRVFTKPGIVKVFCDIHSQMSAVVRVFSCRVRPVSVRSIVLARCCQRSAFSRLRCYATAKYTAAPASATTTAATTPAHTLPPVSLISLPS